MERLLVNVGLGSGEDMIMWTTYGAAPGLVADLFAEFSYWAILLSGLIGWIYAKMWRTAVYQGGLGRIVYVILFALSIFLMLQTLEAIVFRFLFTATPLFLFWYLWMPKERERERERETAKSLTKQALKEENLESSGKPTS